MLVRVEQHVVMLHIGDFEARDCVLVDSVNLSRLVVTWMVHGVRYMRSELVCAMNEFIIRQLDDVAGWSKHARKVSELMHTQRTSCIPMFFGEKVFRKTRWLSAAEGELC